MTFTTPPRLLHRRIALCLVFQGRQGSPLTHDEADDLGHRLEVFGRDFFVNINPGLKRAGQGRVFDQRHVIGLGDFPDPHRQVIDPLGNQYWR